jgi:hypothetical protein
MKKLILLATTLTSVVLYAGSGGSGGVPPALQDEMSMLMSSGQSLALIRGENDNSMLLSKTELPVNFTLTSDTPLLNNAEIELKAGQNVDSVEGQNLIRKSYKVKDGDSLGSFELIDRLSTIRAGRLTNFAQ